MRRVAFIGSLMMTGLAFGQSAPSSRPASRPAASAPAAAVGGAVASGPRNLSLALGNPITIDAQEMPFEKLGEQLRQMTRTNLVINWNAFAEAGITRETPITLRLKNVTFETVVRTLMEVLPTKETRANYTVDENTLEITTNAELAISNEGHIYDPGRAFSYSFNAKPTMEELTKNGILMMTVLQAELVRAGDPPTAHGHSLEVKDGMIAATVSERGQGIVDRTIKLFNQPLRPGSVISGTQLAGASKRAAEAYRAFVAAPGAVSPAEMAKAPEKYGQFNIALLPGTKEELAKEKPEVGLAVNEGGVLLLGPREAIAARTSLGVYDLRDVIKKMAAKSKVKAGQGEFQDAIVEMLQRNIKPEGEAWGGFEDLGKKPSVMVPYSGVLIVFGTAETQRTVSAALQDMNK